MRVRRSFPCFKDAPRALISLPGHCGPISIWMALKYFRVRHSAKRIIQSCKYTKKYGTFTIGAAVCLKEFGLEVALHTDIDRDPKTIERYLYRKADAIGIPIKPTISLKALLAEICNDTIAIVSFDTKEGFGHFSPLIGVRDNSLVLPLTDDQFMTKRSFIKGWNAPEICRQYVLIKRPSISDRYYPT